ncbi:protein DENND6B isoform X2 [Homalodisca vitripennis]|uniref:protein DENND6B isoform X2 n=1 Tax=Homalodisca vitripennis TaxID=197043 RepID=UPI001EECC3EC|nr:protein DENND6B isoform X2 [Homalodisca vitripennis]
MASEQKGERTGAKDSGSQTMLSEQKKEKAECKSQNKPTPWERFSNWIHCICIVTFDLELGQAIEVLYPVDAQLQEEDKANICYLAFPDSNSSCMGDTKFHIRIRQAPGGPDLLPIHTLYNQKCPVYLQIDNGYFYGFVYFRQVKDISLPRGYFQKSVIIISRFPFINLFSEVVSLVAPEFFDHGLNSVEAACHDIDQWAPPIPGDTLNLPIIGTVLQVQVPCDSAKSNSGGGPLNVANVPPTLLPTVLPSIYEINTFQVFSTVLYHMHLLWELVLTAEPIVVMASSPATSAQMVQALVSMITPLMYYADYRPYFTIHDSEFREYTTRTHAPPPIILGVTNPFFAKTLQHWPHIIKVPDSSNGGSFQKHKIRKGNHLKMLDTKPGVYTQYQPFLQKDKTILKKVLKGVQTKRPGEVQSALLRRHLLELTQSFMIPLERYMGTLMPLQKNISPYKAAPQPWPFNPDDFIASLETSGPQLTSGVKGDWVGLYRKFFRSPNFSGWYNARYKGMSQKLQILQLEALSDADISQQARGRRWWECLVCSRRP